MTINNNFFTPSHAAVKFLEQQWTSLASKYQVSQEISEKYFQIILEKYSEKKRFYHNLTHIHALLNNAENLKTCFQNYSAVGFAIWFHDIIYNTKRSNNEEKSAELAVKALQEMQVPNTTIELVEKMIIATKTHNASELIEDGKMFLDLDLGILGTSAETYQQYHQAIRKEYSWVPWFLYKRSRKTVLRGFLAREHIFFTSELAKLEQIARQNITQEIELLSK
jgi:predicted metal-dependent HD superfamily phosphohydrolase